MKYRYKPFNLKLSCTVWLKLDSECSNCIKGIKGKISIAKTSEEFRSFALAIMISARAQKVGI